jgi:putative lipoic acid-binding regulatory protein
MSEQPLPNRKLTRLEVLEVLRANFTFPGLFPITVIARSGSDFYALLHSTLEELQGDAAFSIIERPSSKKNFTSYRIEIHVDSASTALFRKEVIASTEGVLMML